MEERSKTGVGSVEEAHEEILDLAGKMLMKGTSPQMVCSCLIAVALRSYMTLMTKEEVVMLLEHIIEDIDRVKPYDITMPSTEVH